METMFALDLVSLLLSKHAPRQAETSMSSFIKQVAPVGSLNSEIVNPPSKPESATKDISTVSRGWRIKNFNSAANKLLKAGTRLEGEVALESRYWDEVLAVKGKGWRVCRPPRKNSTLSVQYGFLEAAPVFRDRGLASLRRAEDGSLILDKGLIPPGSRFVRVSVRHGSRLSASSKPSAPAFIDGLTIEQQIPQARDSLFEEELFHELVREARSMASCGVTMRENLIRVPVSDDLEIQLDLIDADDHSSQSDQRAPQPDRLLADGIAHAIRLLLTFAHRQNFWRRTQIPPPLTPKRRPNPEYHLLRPGLAYLQHSLNVRWLEQFFGDIIGVLRSSGLEIPIPQSSLFINWKRIQRPPSLSTVEALMGKFLSPIESVFHGDLLTTGSSFTVTVRTNFTFPPFGTNFDVSFTLPTLTDLKSPGRLGLKEEVEAAITHLLLLDVISCISSRELPPLKDSPDSTSSKTRTWDAVYPHLGELVLPYSDDPERYKKLKVSLNRQELSLTTYYIRNIDGVGRGMQENASRHAAVHTWQSPTSPASGPAGQPWMMDFVTAEGSANS